MNRDNKQQIVKTLIQAGRTDLASATAQELAGMPVTRPTAEQVTAASLSRVLRHFQSTDPEVGVVIVSADRSDRGLVERDGTVELDPKLNEKLNKGLRKKLEGMLRSLGTGGYIRTMGGYVEQGTLVHEMSFIVPGVKRTDAIAFAKRIGQDAKLNEIESDAEKLQRGGKKLQTSFRQDAIIWGNSTAGAWLINYDGQPFLKLGHITKMNQVQDLFTELKRRKRRRKGKAAEQGRQRVTFASLEYLPVSPSDWRQWQVAVSRHVRA